MSDETYGLMNDDPRFSMGKWLEAHTVLFSPTDDLSGFLQYTTLRMRLQDAFAKTFPAAGYNHNTRTFRGSEEDYQRLVQEEIGRNENKPADFFGSTGLDGWLKVFYAIKVPFTTLSNTIRLFTEFPLYVFESSFRHLLVNSKLKWNEVANDENISSAKRSAWKFLSGVGIGVGAIGYYAFKVARLAVRLVTAPTDSAVSAWKIHRALGTISGILSCIAIAAVAVFALPVALPVIGKALGPKIAASIAKGISFIGASLMNIGLFAGAVVVAVGVKLGIGIKNAYYSSTKHKQEKANTHTEVPMLTQSNSNTLRAVEAPLPTNSNALTADESALRNSNAQTTSEPPPRQVQNDQKSIEAARNLGFHVSAKARKKTEDAPTKNEKPNKALPDNQPNNQGDYQGYDPPSYGGE